MAAGHDVVPTQVLDFKGALPCGMEPTVGSVQEIDPFWIVGRIMGKESNGL